MLSTRKQDREAAKRTDGHTSLESLIETRNQFLNLSV